MNTAKSTHNRRLPEYVAAAMEAVLEHFWQDEARDWLARSRQEQDGHIFNDMLTVKKWLRERNVRREAI